MSESIIRHSWLGSYYDRGYPGEKRFSITFDDGPFPGATERILDILSQHQVAATFFVIGQNVKKSPDLLRRIDDEGHLIGNHTWTHSRLGMFGRAAYWRDEISRTDEIIHSITGKMPRLFRPPMGWRSPSSVSAIKQLSHSTILWSLKARDGVTTTCQNILNRVLPKIAAGDILLMHDGRDAASRRDVEPTITALPEIILAYQKRGFIATSLDKLLGIDAYASAT